MGVNIWTGVSGTGKTDQMFREIEEITMEDFDPRDVNEPGKQNVYPSKRHRTTVDNNTLHTTLKPLSWNVLRVKVK